MAKNQRDFFLREQMRAIQRELGDKFSLSRYHQAVLNECSVPVKYLPELVRAAGKLTREEIQRLTQYARRWEQRRNPGDA